LTNTRKIWSLKNTAVSALKMKKLFYGRNNLKEFKKTFATTI
jgi:hypothetical protein